MVILKSACMMSLTSLSKT